MENEAGHLEQVREVAAVERTRQVERGVGGVRVDCADQAVEVQRRVETISMEEVVLRILGRDKAEAAIRDDLLDGSGGHGDLHIPRTRNCTAHGPFEI